MSCERGICVSAFLMNRNNPFVFKRFESMLNIASASNINQLITAARVVD